MEGEQGGPGGRLAATGLDTCRSREAMRAGVVKCISIGWHCMWIYIYKISKTACGNDFQPTYASHSAPSCM